MTTLKGIFPNLKPVKGKNFIHENVKNLRRMKQHFHISKEAEEIPKLQVHNWKKVISNNSNNNRNHSRNVLSKMNSNCRIKKNEGNDKNSIVNNKLDEQELHKKSNTSMLNKSNVFIKETTHSTNENVLFMQRNKQHKGLRKSIQKVHEKPSVHPNLSYTLVEDIDNTKIPIKVKNQGIQTLNPKEIDDLYSEGTIKYPSKNYLNYDETINKNETNEQIDTSSRNITNSPLDRGDVQNIQNKNDVKNSKLSSKEEIDFIKLNKERTFMANKIATQMNNSNNAPPTNYRLGVVPKYIKSRKETQEKAQKAKAEEIDSNCPNGHVPLPDCERKETLRILKKNYQDYVNELNMMPIKVDTLRAQQRKIEIEKQLNKLEEGMKVFSRPKVYVKMNT
ncbi:Uncharacterized protein C16orf48 like protein [Habropoda laboriosa]|uniref:Uncharacterized protein C16orf48 like protein n=1 Tax=Habropoda laboriosa TaxID=597456 RepID=A0A0L7RE89_9HYME|nr:PREDICTED: probable WRKY transcription factor protein 1 [Habropoda laboriosa]KOC69135.1 Uncharacterized protein C16orf48 like protein [Habropoda laboriosa]